MPFESKKIKIETLGEYLSGTRKHLGLSLEEVSSSTEIPVKFLASLEYGKFQGLPATVYVIGFLKKISNIYSVSEAALVDQFKKERTLSQEINKEHEPSKSPLKQALSKLVVTPKLISLAAGMLFVLVTVVYIIVQVSSIYGTPKLAILEPKDGQKITSSSVTVSGQTDPGTSLTINDQPIMVEAKDGKFQAVISVTSGQKDLLFVASNKFNKSNTKKVSLLVDTGVAQVPDTSSAQQGLKLVLNFTDQTNVTVTTDEGSPVSQSFPAGSTKIVEAKKQVLLSTSNAGATVAQLNNKLLGPLGKKNESLTNIPFFVETAGAMVSSDDSKTRNKSTTPN